MDFGRLSRAMSQASRGGVGAGSSSSSSMINASEPLALTDLPPNILDALIPGYSIVSRQIAASFGLDISMFVSVAVILIAVLKGGQYLFTMFEHGFRYCCMSNVYIDDSDDLFDQVMAWLDKTHKSTSRRNVMAKTLHGSQQEDAANEGTGLEALSETGMFDYNKWAARTPPRYEPYYGRNIIWHQGRLFFLRRARRQTNQRIQWGNARDEDQLQISVIDMSTQPIKDLLRTIKTWSLSRQHNTTTIRHPTPKDRARFGGAWSKTSSRPSRPMETVILDSAQKTMIIKDMNEYLHPASPKWYATRGIPYRRGYLFHGPPGTGKTSLSFALGGIFGLDIYAISLQEPTLTEGDLMQLFNGLPRRCIVLLEDVDAAGLVRDVNTSSGKKKKKEKKKSDEEESSKDDKEKKPEGDEKKKDDEFTLKDLARELKSIGAANQTQTARNNRAARRGGAGRQTDVPPGGNNNTKSNAADTGISLSGLLNAIDGVATHEGRVLIMTTNHPDKLDAALVRPGRVDRKVEFGLAMKEQMRELFVRMYAAGGQKVRGDPRPEASTASTTTTTKPAANGHAVNGGPVKPTEKSSSSSEAAHQNGKPVGGGGGGGDTSSSASRLAALEAEDVDELATMSLEDLEALAADFAAHVPDDTYTPAEIQNHLMRHKKRPRTAVDTVQRWMDEVEEEKEKQRRADEEAEGSDDE